MADRITFTGRNTAAVRDIVAAPAGLTWFITRGQTASTGGQAWRYARANAAPNAEWGDDVTAALYDPRQGHWLPVRPGDTIVRIGSPRRGALPTIHLEETP